VPDALKYYEPAGFKSLRKNLETVYPSRKISCLVCGWPNPASAVELQNRYIVREVARAAEGSAYGLVLVTPEMRAARIAEFMREPGIVGLKPYKCYARGADPEDARIRNFLTDGQMALADEQRLVITLHLSMRKGISDPRNLDDIEMLAEKYPGIAWNLAHCGRAFIPENMEAIMPALRRLRKKRIYFDIAAVNDSEVFYTLLSGIGPDRILFGSDIPVGLLRGRCVQFGNDWSFIAENTHSITAVFPVVPTFQIYEELRTFRRAARRYRITRRDIGKVFFGNAEGIIREVANGRKK